MGNLLIGNKYGLVIGESVGPIRLGATRSSIVQILGKPERTDALGAI
jgi:hypothetical protein